MKLNHKNHYSMAVPAILASASLALVAGFQTNMHTVRAAAPKQETTAAQNRTAYTPANGTVNPTKLVPWANVPVNSLPSNSSHQEFLNELKPGAMRVWQKYKVLPSMAAAQAIIESYWGAKAPGNNLYGIKATGWNGKKQFIPTTEYINGHYVSMSDWFRAYDSFTDSIDDYGQLIASEWPAATGNVTLTQAANALQANPKHAYASSPIYASTIVRVANDNNLLSWDTEAKNAQESEKIAEIVYKAGYGVLGFNGTGQSISGSNAKFKDGTKWQTFGSKVINGEEMYDLGGGQFVPKKYTDHYDNGVVTIHFQVGYGVNAIHGDGTQILGSNTKFTTGTRWAIIGVKEINGQVCYEVANDTYIPKQYTQWGAGK